MPCRRNCRSGTRLVQQSSASTSRVKRRFLAASPQAKRGYRYEGAPDRMAEVLSRFSPDDDGPAIAMTWYEAAMYCNWLSAREGLPSRSESAAGAAGPVASSLDVRFHLHGLTPDSANVASKHLAGQH